MRELNRLLLDAGALDEAGWRSCWQLVHALLRPVRPHNLYPCLALGYSRDDIFTEFFTQKFFLRASLQPPPYVESQRALAGWWANFCTDVIRHHARYAPAQLDDDAQAPGCEHAEDLPPEQRQQWGQSARTFLAQLEQGLRAMVREHLCSDEHQKAPLNTVARRWQIRSYHYRARQLGLTGVKGAFSDDFSRSAIGRWMRSIGCEVRPDNRAQMRSALEVLCIEASARPEHPPELVS